MASEMSIDMSHLAELADGVQKTKRSRTIGTTALHHNLTVVTRNVKHYNRIPDLLLYPTP